MVREVPGGIHERVVGRGHGLGTEDLKVTMLLTVGATKFRTFVVRMAGGSSFTGGTRMMGTVGMEVFSGLTCQTSSQNDCARVTGTRRNGDGRGYDLWAIGTIIHAYG